MTQNRNFRVGDVRITVTPTGDVHIFGADNVATYGNLREDKTRMVTNVDNNCPNRTSGGQIIKFVHTTILGKFLKLSGGEAAIVSEVHPENRYGGQALLQVRPDGNPKVSYEFTEVGRLACRK